MKLSHLAVNRPIGILMIVCIVLIIGLVSMPRIPIDLYPEMDLPMAVVVTHYDGAGPLEIENRITKPIEEVMGLVSNLDIISSITMPEKSMVVVEFNWGTDMDFATLDMRDKIDLIRDKLPADADDPIMYKMDPSLAPIIQLGVSGARDLASLKQLVEDYIQPQLERIPGVASVELTGGVDREIKVMVDPIKMRGYGIALNQVTEGLRKENINLSGGTIKDGQRELLVRTLGEYEKADDIGETIYITPQGGTVRLGDFATISDGFEEVVEYNRLNQQNSIGLGVFKESDANTVQVADGVHQRIAQLQQELPDDIAIDFAVDQSIFIKSSIKNLAQTAAIGAVLAVIVLYFFLRNIRTTIIIGLAIPLAIISTFNLLYFKGLSINLISLAGLGLGVGMMVDSAIVVLENIYRHRQEGLGLLEAAKTGASEVGGAITASTLTTMMVFLPLIFVEGIASQLFTPLALTVSFSLAASALVALTFIPMLASKFLKEDRRRQPKRGTISRLNTMIETKLDNLEQMYRVALEWALGHRRKVITVALVSLLFTLPVAKFIGGEFMPKMDSGEFAIEIKLPSGALLEETDELVREVEKMVAQIPEVEAVFVTVGSFGGGMASDDVGGELAKIDVRLLSKDQRKRTTGAIMDELRTEVAKLPGAEIKIVERGFIMSGFFASAPVSIIVKGDNLEVLKGITEEIAQIVAQVAGTREVETSFDAVRPEVQFQLDRKKTTFYGLNAAQIARTIKTAVDGEVATIYRGEEDEINLRVQLQEEYRSHLDALNRLTVTAPNGAMVELADLGSLVIGEGPSSIDRESQVRAAFVTADISGRKLSNVMADIQTLMKQLDLPPGYLLEYGGETSDMKESFGQMGLALVLAVFLVYMIMAIQFESLLYPFIIMFAVPLAFTGVVVGLLVTGRPLSLPAMIGVIMLAGIVVNNGIVLVDYINNLRNRGMECGQAILQAGPIRLRPILMTTLTTVLGLVPMALGFGEGAETQAPMATVVVSGLLFSTILTLIVVPVIYSLLDDFGKKWHKDPVLTYLKR